MNELYEQAKSDLEEILVRDQHMVVLQSELFDIWEVATRSCRNEIKRLERLMRFQTEGRIKDAEARNKTIAEIIAEGQTKDVSAKDALALCVRIRDATAKMTFDLFSSAMGQAIDSDRESTAERFLQFKDNPALFLAYRNPSSQAIELLKIILELAK